MGRCVAREGVVRVDGEREEAGEQGAAERRGGGRGTRVELVFVAGHNDEGSEGELGGDRGGGDDDEGEEDGGFGSLSGFVDEEGGLVEGSRRR